MTLSEKQLNTISHYRTEIERWLEEEESARSTLAGAVVVVNALRLHGEFELEAIFTRSGQLVGGRGAALKEILSSYGEDRTLLADGVTTRSTMKFQRLAELIDRGSAFKDWTEADRGEAAALILEPVLKAIDMHFRRQHIRLKADLRESPTSWMEQLFEETRDRSRGRVEQHMVGAKLQKRLPEQEITEHAAFAADVQTAREGDFVLGDSVFHVTAAPSQPVIDKCKDNLRQGYQAILVIPRGAIERAKGIASLEEGLEKRITFLAWEDYIANNIIELSIEADEPPIETFRSIVEIYNQRIEQSETDYSLRIEIE